MSSSTAPFIYEATIGTKQLPTTQVFGLPVPSDTQVYALGSIITDANGTIYRYSLSTGAIAANKVVIGNAANLITLAPASSVGVSARVGVTPYAFTGIQYGFIAVEGVATVSASGAGYVYGDPVAPDVAVAGSVIEHSVANPPTQAEVIRANGVMGFALSAESGGLVAIRINKCL